MIRAVIVSAHDFEDQLRDTLLYRQNVARIRASGFEDVRGAVEKGPVDVVILDAALPGVVALTTALREEPLTRGLSLAGLGPSDFSLVLIELLESGVNAILPLPPGADWDDRLMRLVHVPARKVARFPVGFAVGVTRSRQNAPFAGRALNLSVHGLLLESPFPLEVGEELSLSLALPGSREAVRGTGTVVRLALPEGVGVELTSVEGDGRVRIKRFVESPPPEGDPGL